MSTVTNLLTQTEEAAWVLLKEAIWLARIDCSSATEVSVPIAVLETVIGKAGALAELTEELAGAEELINSMASREEQVEKALEAIRAELDKLDPEPEPELKTETSVRHIDFSRKP